MVTFLSILLVSWLIFMISKCASCQINVLQNTRDTSIRIKSFNIFWSHCDQNKTTKTTSGWQVSSSVSWDANYSHFISPVLYFWYLMGVKESTQGRGDWSQHGQATLSELTCFLWLCLSEKRLPKKDAASWGPHCGAFPSDPSLKASAAAEEIRHLRRLSSGSITTGGAQIWYRPELGSR